MSSLNVNTEAMITIQTALQNVVSDMSMEKTKISKDFVASTDFNLPIPVKEKEEDIHNQFLHTSVVLPNGHRISEKVQ
jgi:hypothetical protein